MTSPSRRLRIAHFGHKGIPADWGGVEAHVEALAVRLAARGHDVTAYVRSWYTPAGATVAGVTLKRLPSVRTKHLDAATHSALAALGAACGRYDVVHVHSVGPNLFSWLPRASAARVVATIHARDQARDKWGPLAKAALRVGERLALSIPHETLVVSRELQRVYRDLGFTTTYLPNGVVPLEPEPADSLAELGLVGGDYLLFLGRWVPSKRVIELVQGYRQLAASRPPLVLAGGDPLGGAYVEAVRAAAAGCPDIICPGLVRGRLKAALFSNALGVVLPSSLEGLPIVLLEAMSYGRAVVASDIAEHREGAADSGSVLLADMTTPLGIRDGLARLVALTGEEREAMGASGRLRVATEYDWERIVDQLEAIYLRLARR